MVQMALNIIPRPRFEIRLPRLFIKNDDVWVWPRNSVSLYPSEMYLFFFPLSALSLLELIKFFQQNSFPFRCHTLPAIITAGRDVINVSIIRNLLPNAFSSGTINRFMAAAILKRDNNGALPKHPAKNRYSRSNHRKTGASFNNRTANISAAGVRGKLTVLMPSRQPPHQFVWTFGLIVRVAGEESG